MTYLLTGGCSWSDINYISGHHTDEPEMYTFPKWSEHLANYLNVELVSTAQSGEGNYASYDLMMPYLLSHNPPKYVVWQLTHSERMKLPAGAGRVNNPIKIPYRTQPITENDFRLRHARFLQSDEDLIHLSSLTDIIDNSREIAAEARLIVNIRDSLIFSLSDKKTLFEETLSMIYNVKRICEIRDIKFFIFNSDRSLINHFDGEEVLHETSAYHTNLFLNMARIVYYRAMKQNLEQYRQDRIKELQYTTLLYEFTHTPTFNILEKDHKGIYGWPFVPELGGTHLGIWKHKKYTKKETTISEFDGHPNAFGQKVIFDLVLEQLKKEWDI